MANSTQQTVDPILKDIYRAENYRETTYKRRPMFGSLPKFEGFGGRNQPVPSKFGNPQGVSSAFPTAQANATAISFEDFVVTRVNMHSVAGIDGETVESTEEDRYAFVEALSTKIDSAMDSLLDSLESYLPRDGDGSLGVIAAGATVSSDTIALSTTADVTNFEVGMKVVSAANATAAVRTGSEVIRKVNRTAGTLTSTSAAWNTVATAIAAGDHLFREGDAFNNTGSRVVAGWGSWIPSTAPTTGDSFFGVDRSADSRLFGVYTDQTDVSIEEAVINGQSEVCALGGSVDTLFMNHVDHRRWKAELGSKEYYDKAARGPDGEANVSFRSIMVDGDNGPIAVIAANKHPGGVASALEMDTWECSSLGPVPKLNDRDGLTILRQANDDGYEVRIVARLNQICKAPAYNGRIALPS